MFRRRQDFSILHPEHVVVRLRDESKVEVNGTSQVGGGCRLQVGGGENRKAGAISNRSRQGRSREQVANAKKKSHGGKDQWHKERGKAGKGRYGGEGIETVVLVELG